MDLFTKIDPPEVIEFYRKDLEAQGYDTSLFNMDWLPDHPPNFLKRKRKPSQKTTVRKEDSQSGRVFSNQEEVSASDLFFITF